MRRQIAALVLLSALGACGIDEAPPASNASASCRVSSAQRYEARELEWQEFDQTGTEPGSFRVLAANGCLHEALAAYDDWLVHGPGYPDARSRAIGSFHRGELRAIGGDTEGALALFDQSQRAESAEDPRAGIWNVYLGGVLGFFARDAGRIEQAQEKLARFDDEFARRQIGVLEGLRVCIDKPYKTAMSPECRP